MKFSFFKAPITNTHPHKDITLADVYRYVKGDFARQATAELRSIQDEKRAKLYKRTHFHYCTCSGTFSKRKFWVDLPPELDTKTFQSVAALLAIAPKTAEKYVTAWIKGGQLVRVAQGKYSKS